MKIFAKISIVILALITQFSCNDWLELPPRNGLVREEFWQTKEDVEAVVMAAYFTFADMDDMLFKYGEMRGDLLKGDYSQSGGERMIMEGSIYPDNGMNNWQNFYKVINYCNEVIHYAPQVQDNDNTFTDYLMYGFMSEAYYLRSLSYFYLVRIFKDVPLVLEPTLTDATPVYPAKSTENQVLDQITTDLEMAREWATVDGYLTIQENKGRATKAAFDAMLADIYLWRFNYEKVLQYVANIEMNINYQLVPGTRWFENYSPGNTLESIFEFQFNDALNQPNSMFGLTENNAHQYDPSDYAIELFDNENPLKKDVNRGLDKSIKMQSKGDYIIWKYIGRVGDGITIRSGIQRNSCNWIVYRLADVILMKAEALSQLERYTEAFDALMEIRERAGLGVPADLYNTPTRYEDVILEERARELAFEGKRWFDLLRMGRRNNYARKSALIEKMVRNVPSTQKRILQTKLTNPLSWYLPVYQTEIERNRNLEQNPYYKN
jgi:starch-binding outer membrane protein, SusD/RagB family